MSSSKYYCRIGNKNYGPVVLEQLELMYARGQITGDTPVCDVATSQWVRYSSLRRSRALGGRAADVNVQAVKEMGQRTYASLKYLAATGEMPMRTTRFVLSIVSLLLALYLLDKADTISAAADLVGMFGGHMDTATGGFLGLCHLASGIVGICAYAKRSPGCLIASAILLSLGVLFSLDVGAYTNLYLFDLITAGFASVYWIAIFRR